MKQVKTNKVFLAILSFIFLSFSLCCIIPINNNNLNYPKYIFPKSSAVYIRKDIDLKLCLPPPTVLPKDYVPACLETKLKSSGSGSIVKNTPNGSLILTANHVCNLKLDIPPVFVIEKMDIKTKVFDFQGREYETEIGAFDEKEDVCLLKVKYLKLPALEIAIYEPEIGDRIYNLSYPAGIYDTKLVMIYEGFYSGVIKIKDIMYSTYSIFAVGGSSGSMLLNHRGELVGMIHSGIINANNINFSPQYYVLKNFLEKNFIILKNF